MPDRDRDRVIGSVESALEGISKDVPDVQDVKVSWPIATYDVSDGSVTTFHAQIPQYCTTSRLLDLAAYGRTESNGTVELRLNEYHCAEVRPGEGGGFLGYENPVNVVVTSRSSTPVLLAATAGIGPGQNGVPQDVIITVSSWDASGDPVGEVPFFWRCRVPIFHAPG